MFSDYQAVFLAVFVGFISGLAYYIAKVMANASADKDQAQAEADEARAAADEEDKDKHKQSKQKNGKKQKSDEKKDKSSSSSAKDKFSHPWLLTSLKGHSGRVLDLDFSQNGKYLASCADDRSVLIWHVKDFGQKEHKTLRGNVQYDHATKVRWSPDSRAYIVQKALANQAEVYKIGKKDDGTPGNIQPVVTFPNTHDTEDVIGLDFDVANGRYVMSCSDKTTLLLWTIRGEPLASLDTYHMTTYCAKVSPCGRFVASSGFTPDVKVWEVKYKGTSFERVQRAFELTGHTSGVYHFDFNADSSKMATLSKDGTWKVFDTKVEFGQGQDPSQLNSGPAPSDVDPTSLLALSPDGTVLAVAHRYAVTWYDALGSKGAMGRIDGVHTQPITRIAFDREGRWLATAGDKHVRLLHNVPGLKLGAEAARDKLKQSGASQGLRERLQEQIAEAQQTLKGLGEQC